MPYLKQECSDNDKKENDKQNEKSPFNEISPFQVENKVNTNNKDEENYIDSQFWDKTHLQVDDNVLSKILSELDG